MAYAALIVVLFLAWAITFVVECPGTQWYKIYLKHVHSAGRSHYGCCGRVPKVSSWVLCGLWAIFYAGAAISIYYYFVGNCQFDKFRLTIEDDEPDHPNYIRGATVMAFFLVDFVLSWVWKMVFFSWRSPLLATFTATASLGCSAVILWAMGTTTLCHRDEFTNRFWMCFGLWLAYAAWWILIWFHSATWWRIEGWKIHKNHPVKKKSKEARFTRKRNNYYQLESQTWKSHYEQAASSRTNTNSAGGSYDQGYSNQQQQQASNRGRRQQSLPPNPQQNYGYPDDGNFGQDFQ